jgi:hypothetical protein
MAALPVLRIGFVEKYVHNPSLPQFWFYTRHKASRPDGSG